MRRSAMRGHRFLAPVALAAGLLGAGPGCTRKHDDLVEIGHVSAEINLPNGAALSDLTYKISGSAISAITGHMDVTKSSHSAQTAADLPAAKGYTLSVDGTTTDGQGTCHGQASFDIVAAQTAQVALIVLCRASADGGDGNAMIQGTFDDCPVVNAHWITSGSAALGVPVKAGVDVTDPDPADSMRKMPISYAWSVSPPGTVSFLVTDKMNPSQPASVATQQFSCGVAGDVTLQVAVSDGACTKNVTIPFRCLGIGSSASSGVCARVTGYSVGSRYMGLPQGEALPVMVSASLGSAKATYRWSVDPPEGGTFANAGATSTTFTCAVSSQDVVLSLSVDDGVCTPDVRTKIATVKCLLPLFNPDAGRRDAHPSDGVATGGAGGAGGEAAAPGGGGGGAGGGGGGGAGGGESGSAGGMSGSSGASGSSCPDHEPGSPGADCDACTARECAGDANSCCSLATTADRSLCEAVTDCLREKACTTGGDATPCFCGKLNDMLCWGTAGVANGACVGPIIAAAKTTDPAMIRMQFTSAASPLGRAVNLTGCRGNICSTECGIQ